MRWAKLFGIAIVIGLFVLGIGLPAPSANMVGSGITEATNATTVITSAALVQANDSQCLTTTIDGIQAPIATNEVQATAASQTAVLTNDVMTTTRTASLANTAYAHSTTTRPGAYAGYDITQIIRV
ncbi:MAG: hypothetical protein NTW60_01280 [Candidatus Wolfebacteria bacterium]|nr:hypothetical protein [Candidatus Wolfebacteria bacterium]